MASDSESDYEFELSEETRKILQQVMAEKEAETERFEALKRQAESDFDQAKQADMSLFTENWQLSQFWYDDETSRALGQEALDNTDDSSVIVCISSPSAFVKLMVGSDYRLKTVQQSNIRLNYRFSREPFCSSVSLHLSPLYLVYGTFQERQDLRL